MREAEGESVSPSRIAEATIEKAKECYELDLITKGTLEFVIAQAETYPEYDPIMDLPFDWTVERERKLRKRESARQLPRWRRILHV